MTSLGSGVRSAQLRAGIGPDACLLHTSQGKRVRARKQDPLQGSFAGYRLSIGHKGRDDGDSTSVQQLRLFDQRRRMRRCADGRRVADQIASWKHQGRYVRAGYRRPITRGNDRETNACLTCSRGALPDPLAS